MSRARVALRRSAQIALLLLVLPSCKHVRVARVDYENHRVTVCGGRWANVDDLNAEAASACTSGIERTLSCGESVEGAVAQTYGHVTVARPVRGSCCEYQCR